MKSQETEHAPGLISPAAQYVMDGEPFDLNGDPFYVENHHSYDRDVLVLREVEYMRGGERSVRRAVQVRYGEDSEYRRRLVRTGLRAPLQTAIHQRSCRSQCDPWRQVSTIRIAEPFSLLLENRSCESLLVH